MDITPGGETLGATITGIDLALPLSDSDLCAILRALGEHGVLCFPRQTLDTDQLAAFGRRFGELEINVANAYHEPNHPEMMILSNMKRDGKQIGANDAGQGWHTDMSYSRDIALANILHAQHVPPRNGKPLGETQFRNMHAAYDDLPDALKHKLEGRTATHDFAKFWDMMVAKPGSTRKPLTREQRAKKPPVSQPIFRRHPITGRYVLYANVGYAMFIDGMDPAGERRDPRLPVPPPGACRVPARAPLDSGRCADVGQHRHDPQRRRRLHRRRAALHAADPGNGDARLSAHGRRLTVPTGGATDRHQAICRGNRQPISTAAFSSLPVPC